MLRSALLLLAAGAILLADPADGVKEAARGWTEGAVKQDQAALDRFLADDLQYAHAGGQTQNKEQYIAAVRKGPPRYESFTFSDVTVRIYGDVGVLTTGDTGGATAAGHSCAGATARGRSKSIRTASNGIGSTA